VPCSRCGDTFWVCETHTDKPAHHDDCSGAGAPCPDCQVPGVRPRFLEDHEIYVRGTSREGDVHEEDWKKLTRDLPRHDEE